MYALVVIVMRQINIETVLVKHNNNRHLNIQRNFCFEKRILQMSISHETRSACHAG